MIGVVAGPLIVEPDTWVLVFDRVASSRWTSWLALGKYKHVRAYAYVRFLHVWVFFDVDMGRTYIFHAADGEPARQVIEHWISPGADLMRFKRLPTKTRGPPILGFCVPAVKRLIGLQCVALRPDALYRQCLRHGGVPFEAGDGLSKS